MTCSVKSRTETSEIYQAVSSFDITGGFLLKICFLRPVKQMKETYKNYMMSISSLADLITETVDSTIKRNKKSEGDRNYRKEFHLWFYEAVLISPNYARN